MPHPERGQVAAEFMLYTTVFMFVVVAAFVVINQLQGTEIPQSQNLVAQETGQGFANIFTLAVKGGEGFSYSYTFPRTIFGLPYTIDMGRLSTNDTFIIDWTGPYGNFSYEYLVPAYGYKVGGSCIAGSQMVSNNNCLNVLILKNDGQNLTISQGA